MHATMNDSTDATAPNPVSIVLPCRNEARHISACLASILANDFPQDQLEVLVVDGLSEDSTRDVIASYARRYPCIRLLNNERRITPCALNIGIRAARFGIIMRMDAHTTYAPDYIHRCVTALHKHGADNVGGRLVTVAREDTWLARAISVALSHRFGVGDSLFRLTPSDVQDVDTVPFGCYRREVFDRVGMFDENLRRGQDMDFNVRLKAAGGRILLVPDVVSYYHPRTSARAFVRHNLWNGVWVFYPMRYGRVAFAPRHLVPGAFVATLLVTGLSGLVWRPARWLAAVAVTTYVLALTVATARAAWTRRRRELLVTLPPTFAALHLAYGLGTVIGLIRVLPRRVFWRVLFGRSGAQSSASAQVARAG